MNHGLPAGIPRPDKLLALTQQSRDNGVMHMHSPHGVSGRSEMTETLKKEGKESATVGVLDDNGAAVAGLRSGKVHVGELRQSEWFFGRNNSMHAAPSIYAVAGTVVGAVLRPNAQLLRHMDAEGAPWSSSNKSAPLSALKLGTLRNIEISAFLRSISWMSDRTIPLDCRAQRCVPWSCSAACCLLFTAQLQLGTLMIR